VHIRPDQIRISKPYKIIQNQADHIKPEQTKQIKQANLVQISTNQTDQNKPRRHDPDYTRSD